MWWFEASLNWFSPADPLPEPWTSDERRHFDQTAPRALAQVRDELDVDWEIRDEFPSV